MHGMERETARLFAFVLCVALVCAMCWVGGLFFRALGWLFSRGPIEPEPEVDEDAEVRHAIAVLERPRQVVGGQYMHWRCVPEPCEGPIEPSEFVVHDRTDPEHRAVCRECRTGRDIGPSGVNFRSN